MCRTQNTEHSDTHVHSHHPWLWEMFLWCWSGVYRKRTQPVKWFYLLSQYQRFGISMLFSTKSKSSLTLPLTLFIYYLLFIYRRHFSRHVAWPVFSNINLAPGSALNSHQPLFIYFISTIFFYFVRGKWKKYFVRNLITFTWFNMNGFHGGSGIQMCWYSETAPFYRVANNNFLVVGGRELLAFKSLTRCLLCIESGWDLRVC